MSSDKFAKHREEVLEAVRKGVGVKRAAELAGVSRQAVYQWIERGELDVREGKRTKYAVFAVEMKRERARTQGLMERSVLRAAADDWRAGAWYLERSLPDEYGRKDKVTVEHQQQLAADFLTFIRDKISPKAFDEILAVLAPEGSEETEATALLN